MVLGSWLLVFLLVIDGHASFLVIFLMVSWLIYGVLSYAYGFVLLIYEVLGYNKNPRRSPQPPRLSPKKQPLPQALEGCAAEALKLANGTSMAFHLSPGRATSVCG